MNYIIKEVETLQEFEAYELDFYCYEDKEFDNRYYIVEIGDSRIGFSFYNLGIPPSIVLRGHIFFIGFGMSILIYNLINNDTVFKSTNMGGAIYEVLYNEEGNQIIYICELEVLGFMADGNLLWECGLRDVISDYKLEQKNLILKLYDETNIAISLENGKVLKE